MNTITESVIDLLSREATSEDIDQEYKEQDAYNSKFLLAKYKFDTCIAIRNNMQSNSLRLSKSANSASAVQVDAKKTYKLPLLEIKKFSSDVREWLKFWNAFKKIHEDSNIENKDKFQLLTQVMVLDSRAEELVNSYPPTGENYPNVIANLMQRYSREDFQIEVYVRQLLQLVLQNAVSVGKLPLSRLSFLPEDILQVWQRLNDAKSAIRGFTLADKMNNVSKNTSKPRPR